MWIVAGSGLHSAECCQWWVREAGEGGAAAAVTRVGSLARLAVCVLSLDPIEGVVGVD